MTGNRGVWEVKDTSQTESTWRERWEGWYKLKHAGHILGIKLSLIEILKEKEKCNTEEKTQTTEHTYSDCSPQTQSRLNRQTETQEMQETLRRWQNKKNQ